MKASSGKSRLSAGCRPVMAERIEKEIGGMVQNCKLPKEVDDQFHLVLIQVSAGTDLPRFRRGRNEDLREHR